MNGGLAHRDALRIGERLLEPWSACQKRIRIGLGSLARVGRSARFSSLRRSVPSGEIIGAVALE
jgi:hypothetical protein